MGMNQALIAVTRPRLVSQAEVANVAALVWAILVISGLEMGKVLSGVLLVAGLAFCGVVVWGQVVRLYQRS